MTCYDCRICDSYKHISKGYVFNLKIKLGKIIVPVEVFLCKKCLKKTELEFKINDGWIELKDESLEKYIFRKLNERGTGE